MTLEFKPMKLTDLALIEVRDEMSREVEPLLRLSAQKQREFFHNMLIKTTGVKDGKILMIVYGAPLTDNTIEILSVMGKDIENNFSHRDLRVARKQIRAFFSFGFNRIQSTAMTDFKEAGKFLQALGFKKESTMKNFEKDGDRDLYVIFKGDK